jgi:tetratricopeptide (TPR) repeat protein
VRRNRKHLERAIEAAPTGRERAGAHYDLAVFHDNNSREAEAIPHYERALELGLESPTRARALAWLASSLYKTGRPREALARVEEAFALAEERELIGFLQGLRRRVDRALADSVH